MATIKMENIDLVDAVPSKASAYPVQGVFPRTISDTVETPAILNIGDKVLVARIPVDALLLDVTIAFDDLGTSGDLDLGFYQGTLQNGDDGAVLDADALSADIDVNAAALPPTDYRYDVLDINTIKQPVWDLATLTEKPEYPFIDIVLTATEATTAIGTISCKVTYGI